MTRIVVALALLAGAQAQTCDPAAASCSECVSIYLFIQCSCPPPGLPRRSCHILIFLAIFVLRVVVGYVLGSCTSSSSNCGWCAGTAYIDGEKSSVNCIYGNTTQNWYARGST